MALLTGYQLQRFGTERLIPGLVAIAFTRELGPLITGIMVAARIGAAFTAELGTMQSFMFGLLIASIACYRGLTVKGGAAGVGTNTTSSVVTAITTVIGFDTVYNVIYTNFYPV